MLSKLKEILNLLFGSDVIKRSDIEGSLDTMSDSVNDVISPMVEGFNTMLKTLNDPKLALIASRELGFKVKSIDELIKVLENDYLAIKDGVTECRLYAHKLPSMMTKSTLTIKQSAYLELTERVTSVVKYMPDMILYMIYRLNADTTMAYTKLSKDILKMRTSYQLSMLEFRDGGVKKKLDIIDKLSDIEISADITEIKEVASRNDLRYTMPAQNFNGNPLYFIGRWWVDFTIDRVNRLKDEKRLLELKIMELQEKEATSNVSTTLSKQIEYYEEKLTKIDKKIKELSDV